MFPNFYLRQMKEQIRRVGLAETCFSLAGRQARAAAKDNARPAQAHYYSQWAERHEAMLAELEKGNLP